MLSNEGQLPPLLPMLSPGKHRSPRSGACFMEFASLLAGERWSDHPACTHPLLAEVAQHVNDYTSDAGRPRLVTLIPSVIGLTGDDPHIDARIALGSATLALPVVSAERQRVMAVSVLACERVLAGLDGRAVGALQEQSRAALAQVPDAGKMGHTIHQRYPEPHDLRKALSPPHRARHRPRRRPGHRGRLCARPRSDAPRSARPSDRRLRPVGPDRPRSPRRIRPRHLDKRVSTYRRGHRHIRDGPAGYTGTDGTVGSRLAPTAAPPGTSGTEIVAHG